MDENIDMIESFKKWCDENIVSVVGYKRTSLQKFNEIVEKSYTQMQSMNKSHDRMSYMCGIAAGIKMMLLPENGDKSEV